MIHWKGKGYLGVVVPIVTMLVGIEINQIIFYGKLPSELYGGLSFVFSAIILQYLVRRFSSLRMTVAPINDNDEHLVGSETCQPLSKQFTQFMTHKRYAPLHTFMWIPLSIWSFILLGVGVSQLLKLQ